MKRNPAVSKKFLSIVILLTIIFSFVTLPEGFTQDKTQILLVNPSLGGVKTFIYFAESGILSVPDVEFDCVYYSKARTDVDRLESFLEKEDYPFIHVWKFEGDLKPDELFRKNSFSRDFYEIFKKSDGVVFFGGPDVPPAVYGQKTELLTDISTPHRHYFELSFIFHLLGGSQNEVFVPYMKEKPDYTVIGFCLGMQTINIATGGTLYQDIPSDIYNLNYVEDVIALGSDCYHVNPWRKLYPQRGIMGCYLHRIKGNGTYPFTTDFLLSSNENPIIYSSHHQAVKDLGKGFVVSGTSMDGEVIEMITHTKYKNVTGVQFHPEVGALYQTDSDRKLKVTPDDKEAHTLNEILIKENSLDFHRALWKYFSDCIKK